MKHSSEYCYKINYYSIFSVHLLSFDCTLFERVDVNNACALHYFNRVHDNFKSVYLSEQV